MGSDSVVDTVDPAIEREYNLRQRHPEREAVYRRFAEASERFRAGYPHRRDLRYAPGPRCLIDVFPARGGAAGPSPLDRRILTLMLGGLTDQAVAAQLDISLRTVQRRVRQLEDLAGVRTRMQLGWYAARHDWA